MSQPSARRTAQITLTVALAVLAGCVVAAAQTGAPDVRGDALVSVFSVSSLVVAAGAAIAWGRQGKTSETHDVRITTLEDDRVTRAEFQTMQQDLRDIRVDLREVLERRRLHRERP